MLIKEHHSAVGKIEDRRADWLRSHAQEVPGHLATPTLPGL